MQHGKPCLDRLLISKKMFSKTLQTHSYPHSVLTWEVIGAMLRKETPSVSFRVNSFNLQQIQMKQKITGVGRGGRVD